MKPQLDSAAKHFINQDKGVKLVGGRLVLSKIFEWYGDDFGGEKGVWKELLLFANAEMRARLEKYEVGVNYEYDWTLNEYRR